MGSSMSLFAKEFKEAISLEIDFSVEDEPVFLFPEQRDELLRVRRTIPYFHDFRAVGVLSHDRSNDSRKRRKKKRQEGNDKGEDEEDQKGIETIPTKKVVGMEKTLLKAIRSSTDRDRRVRIEIEEIMKNKNRKKELKERADRERDQKRLREKEKKKEKKREKNVQLKTKTSKTLHTLLPTIRNDDDEENDCDDHNPHHDDRDGDCDDRPSTETGIESADYFIGPVSRFLFPVSNNKDMRNDADNRESFSQLDMSSRKAVEDAVATVNRSIRSKTIKAASISSDATQVEHNMHHRVRLQAETLTFVKRDHSIVLALALNILSDIGAHLLLEGNAKHILSFAATMEKEEMLSFRDTQLFGTILHRLDTDDVLHIGQSPHFLLHLWRFMAIAMRIRSIRKKILAEDAFSQLLLQTIEINRRQQKQLESLSSEDTKWMLHGDVVDQMEEVIPLLTSAWKEVRGGMIPLRSEEEERKEMDDQRGTMAENRTDASRKSKRNEGHENGEGPSASDDMEVGQKKERNREGERKKRGKREKPRANTAEKRESGNDEAYIAKMKPLQFDSVDIRHRTATTTTKTEKKDKKKEKSHKSDKDSKKQVSQSRYHYLKDIEARPHSDKIRRIMLELSTLPFSLPLDGSGGAFLRVDEERMDVMRLLLIGPTDTPYAFGCFEFDIFFRPEYPDRPPKFHLNTTNNNTFRFNPNLYANGKVCLSLLGTWVGVASQMWNKTCSTLLQVIVSIQSLILVDQPFFNEPGFERYRNTPKGDRLSMKYNGRVRHGTVEYAMIDQITHRNDSVFKEVIEKHFLHHEKKIIETVSQWKDEADMVALELKEKAKNSDKNDWEKRKARLVSVFANLREEVLGNAEGDGKKHAKKRKRKKKKSKDLKNEYGAGNEKNEDRENDEEEEEEEELQDVSIGESKEESESGTDDNAGDENRNDDTDDENNKIDQTPQEQINNDQKQDIRDEALLDAFKEGREESDYDSVTASDNSSSMSEDEW